MNEKEFQRKTARDIAWLIHELKCLRKNICDCSDIVIPPTVIQNNKVREIILPSSYTDYDEIDTYLSTYNLIVAEDEIVIFTAEIKYTVDENLTESRFWRLGKGIFNPVAEHWEDMPINYLEAIPVSGLELGETSTTAYRGDRGKVAYDHTFLTNNPHSVTKAQIGLSDVDNTSDVDKPISTLQQQLFDLKADLVGGLVPSAQLPPTVDEIQEYADFSAFPGTGVSNIYYLDLATNKTYRWSGTVYVPINEGIALGETSSTAYRGDRGKIAYDHSQVTSGNPHNVTKAEVGLGNVDDTSDANKPVSTAQATAIAVVQTDIDTHEANTSNPHGVTKAQVGLSNVDNTADTAKPVSTAQQAALDLKQDKLTQSALTYATPTALDFTHIDEVRTIALTGNLTFSDPTNRAAGLEKIVILTADASIRTLSFPATWIWTSPIPASIAATKTGVLYLYCKGTTTSDVVASYAAQTN